MCGIPVPCLPEVDLNHPEVSFYCGKSIAGSGAVFVPAETSDSRTVSVWLGCFRLQLWGAKKKNKMCACADELTVYGTPEFLLPQRKYSQCLGMSCSLDRSLLLFGGYACPAFHA